MSEQKIDLKYDPYAIEDKWQQFWSKHKSFEPKDDKSLAKKYVLSMFPYPSGKIHMGHVRNYTNGDAFARYYRKKGFNVLHPIGFDSFGMPAEDAAIKKKLHAKTWTYDNIDYMTKQFQKLGFSFSEARCFATSDEAYTKIEQYLFIKMYEKGLIYKKNGVVNWCEHDQTVLANEQVEEGACWRCGNQVLRKEMPQYFFKITAYAEELLADLVKLKGSWPSKVLEMQTNWIGKSQGLAFKLIFDEDSKAKLNNHFDGFEVFTTRADTIFGITYCLLAPEHDIVKYLIDSKQLSKQDSDNVAKMKLANNVDRSKAEKIGIKLDLFVLHPITCKKLPVWIGNFVIVEYGTGAVMAVPAHDKRDFDFAKKYNLPINFVIKPFKTKLIDEEAFVSQGEMINSSTEVLDINGLKSNEAKVKVIDYFETSKKGSRVTNYKLKDWSISRQRYWGAPIPLINCQNCGVVVENVDNLPITLPENIDLNVAGSALGLDPNFKHTTCPKCQAKAIREIETMDTFVQSSWYYLRFMTKGSLSKAPCRPEDMHYWQEVDLYIGGIEHAILHLLYARFFHKVLRDLDFVNFDEPFSCLLAQGMVLQDGKKMSKSKGNVVDPDTVIKHYGADTARLFILFAAPPAKAMEWNDKAVEGCFKFLSRLYKYHIKAKPCITKPIIEHKTLDKKTKLARLKVYEALQKYNLVFEDSFALNTLVAIVMEAFNYVNDQDNEDVWTEAYFILLYVLEPIAPHLCWELSDKLFQFNNFKPIDLDEKVFIKDEIILGITINGKRKDEIEVTSNSSKEQIIKLAEAKIINKLKDKIVVKIIVVPNKLVNFVLK